MFFILYLDIFKFYGIITPYKRGINMKKNYSSKLVFDYITGNEITGYNIDDLENDYEFMIQVMKHTKDKNMYNLCSKEVQTNYKFVKFMIETFKNDLKFICDVADNYLKTVPSESIDGIEIMIQVAEKIEYRKVLENPKLASFSLYAKTMSSVELYQVSNALDMLDDKELKEELGLGFAYIADKFENRETICNYKYSKVSAIRKWRLGHKPLKKNPV